MVCSIKAIDSDNLLINCKSVNKKNSNKVFEDCIVSYDSFFDEIFFHNETKMIGNVCYEKGILEVDHVDFSKDNYKEYTNVYRLDGSNDEFDCISRYINFLDELEEKVTYYDKTKEERIAIIDKKKKEIEDLKILKNKAIDYSYTYAMDEEMDLLPDDEIKDIYKYIKNNKEEVINSLMKDTNGYKIDKIANLFRFGLISSAYSGLYALNNPRIGTAIMAGGAFISIGGLIVSRVTKHDQLDYKIKLMMDEISSIYDLWDKGEIISDRVLREIDIALEYIDKYPEYDLSDVINKLNILKERYIEKLKDRFQFGDIVDEKEYCNELAQIEMEMYDITCINNSEVNDMYIRMAYEVINDIINNPYPGCKEDLLLVKRFALDYLKADLAFVGFDYQHLFIDRLLDLKICIKDKRYAIEDGRRINKFII